MFDAIYIGDELTATGFLLVGVRTHPVPESPETLWNLILAECERCQLVLLSDACADMVRVRLEDLIETQPLPPIMIVPDDMSVSEPSGTIRGAYEALGIEGGTR